ncbi:MAG: SDR family oxidoreductase [Candidatus Azobacteroides sp.]|nr:SDR family oxidoreductase [Candidatus Azobacteroides sp.]
MTEKIENKDRYVLITGASGGIGLEFSKVAARNRFNLILIARNTEKLTAIKNQLENQYEVQIHIFSCDLSSVNAVSLIKDFLFQEKFKIDILINNAGFGLYGEFKDTNSEKETEMLQLNVVALTQLTKVIYQQMQKEKKGKILNISSVAGFFPGPLMSVYYASKAYVLSFSQALAEEAKGSGVTITVLCPGPTLSGFEERAHLSSSMLFKSFGKLPSAQDVAEYGFKKMQQGKRCAIYGWKNKLMVFGSHFLFGNTISSIVKYVQRTI